MVEAPDLGELRQPGLKWWARRVRYGGIVSVAIPAAAYFLYFRPKWARHQDFLANADPYWMMEHMCKRDLLQACPRNVEKMINEE